MGANESIQPLHVVSLPTEANKLNSLEGLNNRGRVYFSASISETCSSKGHLEELSAKNCDGHDQVVSKIAGQSGIKVSQA